jgi:hypothetical protein
MNVRSVLLLGAVVLGIGAAQAAAARPHSTDPMDWIIQHVCADAADKPIPADPYGGCPSGAHERRLKVGEPLPYYRHDEPVKDHPLGYQRHDAYPLVDRHYGGVFSANDFDFDYIEPYGVMHPGDGDGFDVYRVAEGWVSGGGTRDGGGFSASHFGTECKPWNGWVFFPVAFLRELRPGAAGRAMVPIRGSHWEEAGEPWPGRCEIDKGFSKVTLSTWFFEPNHEFGGLNGTPKKQIDAIVATHGSALPPNSPLGRLHLERIYFTDLYGATRWESWFSNPDNPPRPGGNCGGPTTMTYEGAEYVRAECRDWSITGIYHPPRPHAPWPYPETNILADWHFNNDDLSPWVSQGALKASPENSRTAQDAGYEPNGPGLRYLRLSCPESAQDCGGTLHQDIPIKDLPKAKSYDYGFSGALAAEGDGDGMIEVSLSQRDAEGRSLWEDRFTAHVRSRYRKWAVEDSVYKASSAFLKTAPDFELKPGAVSLRLTLAPKIPQTYDILDTWIMPR